TARAGRRGLELRGEARLRGVRIESLPLEVVVGSGRRAIEHATVATSAREDGWCSFAARVAADDTRRVRDVSVRLRLPGGERPAARVLALAPPKPPAPPLRSRLDPRRLVEALNRLSRRRALRPARRAAVGVVRRSSLARRAY